MAVPAHTSLVSFSNLLDDIYDRIAIQYPALDAQPFDGLREGVNFLLNFVEAHSQRKSKKLESLWRKITEVASEADDIVDAHVVDLLYKESQGEETSMEHSTFSEDMDRVKLTIEIIKTELLIAIEEREETDAEESNDYKGGDEEGEDTQREEDVQALTHPKVSSSSHASSSTSSHGKDDIMVGLDKKVETIMSQLAGNGANLQIITITGMGGIGKTTLAETVYGSSYIVEYFDVRLWVVASQKYVKEKVLQSLIESGEKKFFSGSGASEEHEESDESSSDLGGKLYRGLFGRRYLIVMDDVWSTKVWDDLKRFFPNNGNGSRIMMTTRDLIVASSLSSSSNMNRMNCLDNDSSWKLLCQKAFSDGVCPNSELEEVGKNIAEGCKGLPLSIIVIGGMLASSKMTREHWVSVAKDVNFFRNSGDGGRCLALLSLSYHNLPIHLKACFLHMRCFDKGIHIPVRRLYGKWIIEGFIPQKPHRSLESVAEEYLMTLVGKNLISIGRTFVTGQASYCGVHDLVSDLCWREYHKEHFIHSPIRYQNLTRTMEENLCFLCGKSCGDKEEFNFPSFVFIPPLSSQVSPSMCEACAIKYQYTKRLNLVKGMYIVGDGEYSCRELVHATKMQSIDVRIPKDLNFISPSFIHLLWRLRDLTIWPSGNTTPIVLPLEIGKMPHLRCIIVKRAVLPYQPITDIEEKDFIIMKYLHTLGHIRNFMCTPELVRRIPNLKTLGIWDPEDSWKNSLCNLADLHKLEELEVDKPILTLENMSFPNTLQTLILRLTRIPWEEIGIIGSLPNLEWLTLDNACIGPEWNPTEGEFPRLKVLEIESTELFYWRAENIHFPKLERLYLERILHELEIPSDIGHITTLKEIGLKECGKYVIDSAKQIWKEQQDYGNELKVHGRDRDGRYYRFGDES